MQLGDRKFQGASVSAVGSLLAILGICLGVPQPEFHVYPAAFLGLSPLFALAWRELGGRQIRLIAGVWVICCAITLAPDFRSVGWLSPLEIGVGVLGYLLLPWLLIAVTLLSLVLTRSCPDGIRPLAMAAVWVLWDLGWAGLKFPIPLHWGALFYDWIWGIQIADGVGIWGVTFYGILINATVALWVHPWIELQQKQRGALIAGLLTLVVLSYGGWRLAQWQGIKMESPSYTVAGIQPVAWLERDRSWDYRLSQYQQLSQLSAQGLAQGAQLVIWPEGALRARLRDTPLEPFVIEPMASQLPAGGALLLGTTEPDPTTLHQAAGQWHHHNVALLYNAAGDLIGQTGKRWIFPLFESQRYVPYGTEYAPILTSEFGPIGVLICLESVLPDPSQALVRAGAESLIVLADDSSFGQSNWVALHGALSVFRAIETRRSLVFVNNTGSNLIVDPLGRIQHQGPLFEPAAIQGQVVRQERVSPFASLSSIRQGLFN